MKWILGIFKFIFYLWSAPFVLLFGTSLMKNEYISYLTKGKRGFFVKLVLIFGFISVVWLFIVTPTQIGGYGMEPAIHHGEWVILNKIAYEISSPKKGDVLTFKYPKNQDVDYIGRVIAIPGDTIQIKEGLVYLNGLALQEPYITGATIPSKEEGGIKENEVINVPEESFFVLMDNRQHGADSRHFGLVQKNLIIARVYKLPGSTKLPSQDFTGEDLYNAGLYFIDLKNTAKAEEYFIKAGNEYKNVSAINELGNIYSQRKNYALAIQTYQRALEIEPENPIVLQNIGSTYWNMEDKNNATTYLQKSLAAYEKGDAKADEKFLNFLKEIGIFK